MVLKFTVYHQTLSVPYKSLIVSRSQDYLRAVFSFSEDWLGTQKIAQFVRGELKYNILLDSTNACYVPWELLQTEGSFTVTVWGNNEPDADNIIITTNKLVIQVHPDGLDDELLPTDPTIGLEGGLLTQCQDAAAAAKQSEDNAAISETHAGNSETAAAASAAAALLSEQHAKASEDAALLSEQHAKASEDAALLSEQHAAGSANDALGYKNAASGSATAADASAKLAQKWANYTDGVVAEGEYSAKKYAQDASDSAAAAAASAAVLANSPHFAFDGNGYLWLEYTS